MLVAFTVDGSDVKVCVTQGNAEMILLAGGIPKTEYPFLVECAVLRQASDVLMAGSRKSDGHDDAGFFARLIQRDTRRYAEALLALIDECERLEEPFVHVGRPS